jgi:hypothetical protein
MRQVVNINLDANRATPLYRGTMLLVGSMDIDSRVIAGMGDQS